ncbi:hypothetical protein SDJN03_02534, partial [Cucurbita argyrosperma subsp. sororia]
MEPHSYSSSSSSFSFYYSDPDGVHKASSRSPKKAVAPPPPMPPRVYKVEPIEFRDVVQKLTSPPEYLDPRLKAMPAPRPNLSNPPPCSSRR